MMSSSHRKTSMAILPRVSVLVVPSWPHAVQKRGFPPLKALKMIKNGVATMRNPKPMMMMAITQWKKLKLPMSSPLFGREGLGVPPLK
jgi:hypothetical protein